MDLRMPMLSASSSARRMPAVSTSLTGMPDGYGLADQVAGGAGRGGDDGAFPLDQAIEQARLADVRAADDGQRQAFVDNLAVGECASKFLERSANRGDALENLRGGKDGDVVFGEVDAGFEHCNQLDQFLFAGLQAARESPVELLRRNLRLVESL